MHKFVFIGDPVDKARTPKLLNAMCQARDLDAYAFPQRVTREALATEVSRLKSDPEIAGILVTMPHKAPMAELADELTRTARRLGSVNVIRREHGGIWRGAQFDGLGLVNALRGAGVDISGTRVLVLGSGDAGTAIALALAHCRPSRLDLFDLDADRAKRSASLAAKHLSDGIVTALSRINGAYDIVVNATPLGMFDDDPSPIDPAFVARALVVADIASDRVRSELSRIAVQHGAKLVQGIDVVEGQLPSLFEFLRGGMPGELPIDVR